MVSLSDILEVAGVPLNGGTETETNTDKYSQILSQIKGRISGLNGLKPRPAALG